MSLSQTQSQSSPTNLEDTYFDFQASIGMTKHIGGTMATDELIKLSHVNEKTTVLDVGCGVGLTACYIAKTYQARVVGVDVRPQMVERATQYAREANLLDFVNFRVADAQALPMSDDSFDVVICESVLAFVPDKLKALREFKRVTKPGGYVGYTEAIWLTPPEADVKAKMDSYTGMGDGIQLSEAWEKLIQQVGLENITCHHYPLSLMEDAKTQIQRMGVSRLLKAWGETFKLMLTDSEYRAFMVNAGKMPKRMMKNMGYGVYMGQVP